jgi:CheY-like chemotaxis protein
MKRRLLIIESDKHLNKVNEIVLRASGVVADLHIANNGKEALDYIKSQVVNNSPLPDIIVFDLQMSVSNGFEFIDKFTLLDIPGKNAIELVVFTASSKPSDRQMAFSKGIKHYLSKPYLLRGIRDIVSQLQMKHADKHAGGK